MIFVTLGTQDKSFHRLLKEVEKQIDNGTIKEKVVVQAGYTKYKSSKMEIFDSIPKDEFEDYIKKASLIITHGGVGSILTALEFGKKVIAVPRLKKYKEHTNDHQEQIVKEFTEQGYILGIDKISSLHQALEKSRQFEPKKYTSNKQNFQKLITDYIEKENHISWYNRDRKMIVILFINFFCFFFLRNLLNPYLNLTLCYFLSVFFSYLFKIRKVKQALVVIFYCYLLEFSLFLLLREFYCSILIAKGIINFLFLFLYHYLDKRRGI